jgi:hypothetical protein
VWFIGDYRSRIQRVHYSALPGIPVEGWILTTSVAFIRIFLFRFEIGVFCLLCLVSQGYRASSTQSQVSDQSFPSPRCLASQGYQCHLAGFVIRDISVS